MPDLGRTWRLSTVVTLIFVLALVLVSASTDPAASPREADTSGATTVASGLLRNAAVPSPREPGWPAKMNGRLASRSSSQAAPDAQARSFHSFLPHILRGPAISPAVLVRDPAPVLVGAGDIAVCNSPRDEATADLLDRIPGTVFTLGDNAYPSGSANDFLRCYEPSWGRHKARTRPAPGNHDYETPGAAAYFAYFGAAAGDPSKGYYSYDLGTWHIVILNSNCREVGGCHRGSPQEQWLRADLAAHPARCTLAYWHHAYFSSGYHGG